MADKIENGDHVIIGSGRVHWVVVSQRPVTAGSSAISMKLRSGMSNRTRTVVTTSEGFAIAEGLIIVRLFKKGTP